MSAPAKRQKMIYFLKPIDERGPIKIGCSVAAKFRLQALSIVSPVRLELVACTPGGHIYEKRLHRHFAKQRRHGEWFEVSEPLERLIDAVQSGASIETALLGVIPKQLPVIIVPPFIPYEVLAAKAAAKAAKLAANKATSERGDAMRARKKEREAKVAELMADGKRTYQQVAGIIGVSRQRVHQIHEQQKLNIISIPLPRRAPPVDCPDDGHDERRCEPNHNHYGHEALR
jgi:DNA-binding CsgD family transcriptional regulator